MATTPVTSCECERSFSRLRRIKTYLSSTMSEDRLNGIYLLYIHKDIEIDCIILFPNLHYVIQEEWN